MLENICIIISLYNESEIISQVLSEWQSTLNSLKITYSIVIINDGSTDSSLEIVKSIQNKDIVLLDQKNSGHGPSSYLALILIFSCIGSYWKFIHSPDSLSPLTHTRLEFSNSSGIWDKEYMNGPQKLSLSRLNLNSWGGFHELRLAEDIPYKNLDVTFDFFLVSDSQFSFLFNGANIDEVHGLRISNNSYYPSIYFIMDKYGKYKFREEVKIELSKEHNLKATYSDQSITIEIDGKTIIKKEFLNKNINFGFIGNREQSPVLIDNFYIDGIKKSFSPQSIPINVFVVVLLISGAIFIILRNDKNLLHVNNGLTFVGIIIFTFIYYLYTPRYFTEFHNVLDDNYVQNAMKERQKDYINNNYTKRKIFFYGGSKTYGDGSGRAELNWINQLKKKLKKKANNFDFINWGIPSANSTEVLQLIKENIIHEADLIVLHMGANDNDKEEFKNNIINILQETNKLKIKVILIEEGKYIHNREELLTDKFYKNYEEVMSLCGPKLYCIRLRDKIYDTKLYDSGNIWAEWIHNTSYGQELFSELILNDFIEVLNQLKEVNQ